MALPVLITVGALGVGWVALSRARHQMPTAQGAGGIAQGEVGDPAAGKSVPPPGNVPITTPSQLAGAASNPGTYNANDAGPGAPAPGGQPVITSDGLGVVVDPAHTTSGADPTTAPLAGTRPDTKGGGIDGPDQSPTGGVQIMQAVYGTSVKQVPAYQQSRQLREIGPSLGMVW